MGNCHSKFTPRSRRRQSFQPNPEKLEGDSSSSASSSTPNRSITPQDHGYADPGVDAHSSAETRKPLVLRAQGPHIFLDDGRRMLDASSSGGVVCIGHARAEVRQAMSTQADSVCFAPQAHFDSRPARELEEFLVQSTGGRMSKVYLTTSASESIETALKLAREFFVWQNQPQRTNFISRDPSFHGHTLGALSISSPHPTTRTPFAPLLLAPRIQHLPPRSLYRPAPPASYTSATSSSSLHNHLAAGPPDPAALIARQIAELEARFLAVDPATVAAVVVESVTGLVGGCAPPPPGYLAAVRRVCDRFGALLIVDEAVCGMGRTGTLHAWEQEWMMDGDGSGKSEAGGAGGTNVVPDIQTVGPALGGGYASVAGVLVGARVARAMEEMGREYAQAPPTWSGHAPAAAAAMEVQRLVKEEGMLANVRAQGKVLGRRLREAVGAHPHVGDVRGRGLFWGIEFVRDRATKEPFAGEMQIAQRIQQLAMTAPFNLLVYAGQGCAGDGEGDHIIIMPPYNIEEAMAEEIVNRVSAVIHTFFERMAADEE